MITKKIQANEAEQRLDKYLMKLMPQAGISFCCKMLRKKNITKNGKKADGKEIVKKGDSIELFLSDETFHKMQGDFSELDNKMVFYHKAFQTYPNINIVYEDNDFLFLNKPSGILSQQSESNDLSVNEWMIGYLLERKKITLEELKTFRPSVCNRLDRNTSGLLLCSKTLGGSQILSSLLKERTMHKFYRCIVKGNIDKEMTLDGYLVKEENNIVKIFPNEVKDSSHVITKYKPVKHDSQMTELEVELVTGKTHQIRAHLNSIGHPILGDPKYGDIQWNNQMKYHKQLLHAYRVVFPLLNQYPSISDSEIICPLPEYWIK